MNRQPFRPMTIVLTVLAVVLLATLAFVVVALLDKTPAAGEPADKTLLGLSLERKIGQMICPDITAGYVAEDAPRLAQWVRNARAEELPPDALFALFEKLTPLRT